jgi:hypothetical protein
MHRPAKPIKTLVCRARIATLGTYARTLTRCAAGTEWSGGGEPKDAIKAAPQLKPIGRPRAVYCFFDNTDEKLRAPTDAQVLMQKIGLARQIRGRKARQATPGRLLL